MNTHSQTNAGIPQASLTPAHLVNGVWVLAEVAAMSIRWIIHLKKSRWKTLRSYQTRQTHTWLCGKPQWLAQWAQTDLALSACLSCSFNHSTVVWKEGKLIIKVWIYTFNEKNMKCYVCVMKTRPGTEPCKECLSKIISRLFGMLDSDWSVTEIGGQIFQRQRWIAYLHINRNQCREKSGL